MNYVDKIVNMAKRIDCAIIYRNEADGILVLENEQDGITNLILGVAPPILIMEMHLFSFEKDEAAMFKALLQKNRDTLHGAFAISEDGSRVLYRYTMQIETLDDSEFEGAINALGLLLSEFGPNIIEYAINI